MKRTRNLKVNDIRIPKIPVGADSLKIHQIITETLSRTQLALTMGGTQYDGDRKIYKALGYPEDAELTFEYFYKKYERQDIASAVIDRPSDSTWNGNLQIIEADGDPNDSELVKAWIELDDAIHIKSKLRRIDKLSGIGQFAILLLGFDDVKDFKNFKDPVEGKKGLLYLKPISEGAVKIKEWITDTKNPRYGWPRIYQVTSKGLGDSSIVNEVLIHHSRVLHISDGSLISDIYGRPRLKPIINRLIDLEKLMGGDAEMFWRGARPGYTAKTQPDFEMSDDAEAALENELAKYEHDLRRFISLQGVDLEALESQVSDPLNHVDIQIQGISAQTGIPKRILIGSERGELASSQDKSQWLSLISTRQTEYAEPTIVRPFIKKLMEHGILPEQKEFNVMWEDVFAPSEAEKVDVGKKRAEALKTYLDAVMGEEVIPKEYVYKYILGLTEEQAEELIQAAEEAIALMMKEEDDQMEGVEDPIPVGENGQTQSV